MTQPQLICGYCQKAIIDAPQFIKGVIWESKARSHGISICKDPFHRFCRNKIEEFVQKNEEPFCKLHGKQAPLSSTPRSLPQPKKTQEKPVITSITSPTQPRKSPQSTPQQEQPPANAVRALPKPEQKPPVVTRVLSPTTEKKSLQPTSQQEQSSVQTGALPVTQPAEQGLQKKKTLLDKFKNMRGSISLRRKNKEEVLKVLATQDAAPNASTPSQPIESQATPPTTNSQDVQTTSKTQPQQPPAPQIATAKEVPQAAQTTAIASPQQHPLLKEPAKEASQTQFPDDDISSDEEEETLPESSIDLTDEALNAVVAAFRNMSLATPVVCLADAVASGTQAPITVNITRAATATLTGELGALFWRAMNSSVSSKEFIDKEVRTALQVLVYTITTIMLVTLFQETEK